MQGIYKIRNKINEKYYVGSSINVERRWGEHQRGLNEGSYNKFNPYLQNAWNKYGRENFIFKIAEEIENEGDLRSIEQEYLDKGFELGILYNTARIAGGGNLGPEVNQRISKNHADQWGINNPMYGKHHTEETCAKISKNNARGFSGKHHTEGSLAKMSGENNPMYGKTGKDNPFYGRHHTEEWKQKESKRKSGEGNPRYGGEGDAKPYPAFYNEGTNEFIPAGINLAKLSRGQNLNYMAVWNLRQHNTKQSHDGWRLATESEIAAKSITL